MFPINPMSLCRTSQKIPGSHFSLLKMCLFWDELNQISLSCGSTGYTEFTSEDQQWTWHVLLTCKHLCYRNLSLEVLSKLKSDLCSVLSTKGSVQLHLSGELPSTRSYPGAHGDILTLSFGQLRWGRVNLFAFIIWKVKMLQKDGTEKNLEEYSRRTKLFFFLL